jgi:hypothetical protein
MKLLFLQFIYSKQNAFFSTNDNFSYPSFQIVVLFINEKFNPVVIQIYLQWQNRFLEIFISFFHLVP